MFDASYRKTIPNLTAWFEGLIAHKNITARIGGIKLVSKALKAWDPNAVEEEEVEEKKADDDDLDLFGDDNKEDAAAAKAIADKMKADAKENTKAPKKSRHCYVISYA